MYRYDEIDQRLVDERVAQFRDQTRRFLAGKLSEDEFRALRLRNGLYIQRYAPMLRIAIPYGLLSTKQLRKLAHIARKYDRGYGHFSTRQNLQLNWPKLPQVPDILAELATVQMHAIQTSGNSFRNITTDHFAGVAQDEIVNSFAWCEILRQWSTFHPEFSYLPRKFKFAVNGAKSDRAAVAVHDIGLHAVRDANGEVGFKVLVGGGLGRTPMIGFVIREFLPWRHLLSYCEAILRVYNRYGRRARREPVHAAGLPEPACDLLALRSRARVRQGVRELAQAQRSSAQAAGVRRGDAVAQEDGRAAGGRHLGADGKNRRPRRPLFVRRAPGLARAEPDLRRRAAVRPPQPVGRPACAGLRHAKHRAAHQHHLLPGRRFLLPRERQVDPGGRGDPAALRRPRLPARHR